MKRTFHLAKWWRFLLSTLTVTLGLMLSGALKEGKVPLTLKSDSAGANPGDNIARSNRGGDATASNKHPGAYHHIYDRSPADSGSLMAKSGLENDVGRDLWFRDAVGDERFIARHVIGAKFSPDGHKIAYATSEHEVFIETLKGERLAEIPRASDPMWRADSMTLSFSAIPSLDYPELQQVAVCDLNSGQATESSQSH